MRKNIVKRGLVAAATLAVTLGLAVGAAQADPSFTPDADDIVGVGSDTTEFVLNGLASGYNATSPTPTRRLASFDATGTSPITIRTGVSINRPNGSSAGISTLLANTNVSFARSSRSITAAEAASPNNLRQFPFARDGLRVVANASGGSPASLTAAQLVSIYKCDASADTWAEVGGTGSATIKPLLPQANSGTRTFFLDQLKAANGNVDVPLGACVTQGVQEHDPAPIVADVNALAPFSLGRFNTLPAATKAQLKLLTGFTPSRVLYNVVRLTDVSNSGFLAIFGPTGYICSAAGQTVVTNNGFQSLSSGCGIPRDTPLP